MMPGDEESVPARPSPRHSWVFSMAALQYFSISPSVFICVHPWLNFWSFLLIDPVRLPEHDACDD